MKPNAPLRRGSAAACFALALLLLGGLIGHQLGSAAPANDSPEAGFARDMQAHHAQAVQMSILIREQTEDEEIRTLALDILTSQEQQMGQMYAWLSLWGLPQTGSEPPMAWMGHAHGTDGSDDVTGSTMMPGMASEADLAVLIDARGRPAEVQFLKLMIAHHEGGVAMASAAQDLADQPQVLILAGAITTSQEFEITEMRRLLEARGGR